MVTHKHRISKIVDSIISGNQSFMDGHEHTYFEKFHDHQTPEVTLLTCSDSRVQVNVLGLDAMNEVFVVRNIGNQIMPVFGSVDYGILQLKTPLLLILGHTHCGAIKAVFQNYEDEPFDIIRELDHLSIPFRHFKTGEYDHEKEWLNIIEHNVDYQVKLAVKKYHKLIVTNQLTVFGVVDDFINAYGGGEGRLIFINVNGVTDPDVLKESPFFEFVSQNYKNIVITRS
jgi:carbonic anhydrase